MTKPIGKSGLLSISLIIMIVLATFTCNVQAAGKPQKVKTFDDMLKYWGIKNPAERKYIEDSTKQLLQDEISELVDTGLDVVDYLQVLDHFANGEHKKANNYLAEKVLCKMLEKMIGGPAMQILTAAWDFDKYVWTSVQAWAEQQDKDLFHQFLVSHVKSWRLGKQLDEMKDRRQLVKVFDKWWNANVNKLGRTKMYGNRQKYYKEFKDACLNRFMDVADRNLQALEANEALNLAVRQKLFVIEMNIYNRRRDFQNALRALKRANLKPTPTLARKYLTDKAYRQLVSKLAEQNKKSSLENDSQILSNADADISTADQAATQAENVSDNKSFTIVHLPLGAFTTFVNDYKTIAELAYSDAAYPQEIKLAVANWCKKVSAFRNKVASVSKSYEKMSYNGKLTKSQKKQLSAERERIRKAMTDFHQAVQAEYSIRAQQTNADIYALKSQVEKIRQLYEKQLERNIEKRAWDWQKPIQKTMKKICDNAGNNTSAGPYLIGMLRQPAPKYSDALVAAAINKIAPDPLNGMDKVAKCYEDCVEAYKAGLADLQRDIFARINANQAILDQRVEEVLELEKAYEPIEAQDAFLATSKSWYIHLKATGLKKIDFKYHPGGWQYELSQDNKDAMKFLKLYHCRLAAMLNCQIEMRLDFEREKNLLSQAQKLLADANALAARYTNAKKQDEPEKPANTAIAILRGGDKQALFDQMVSRNRAVMKPLNGTMAIYKNVLRPAAIAAYRLDKPPFEGWRRYPQDNADLVKAMEAALENADQTQLVDKQNAPVLNKCKKILKQLDDIGRQTKLLSRLVGEISDQAEKQIRRVQDTLSPELHPIIKDIKADRKTLDSFKKFVALAAANHAADNQTMQKYLGQAKTLMAARAGKHNAKNLQRASELLTLATEHVKVMQYYALYKGSWRFDAKIKELKQQLGQLGSGADTDDEPMKFSRGGIFTVSLNGTSIGQTSGDAVHEITAERGKLAIKSETYSRVFQNAKQVMLRLTPSRDRPGKFITVANNQTAFTYDTTVEIGRVYTLELRLITSGEAGYEPRPFPVKFRASEKKTNEIGGVKVFRIRRQGEIIELTAPLGSPMVLKFSKGLATDQPELFVLGTGNKPLAGIAPNREMAMANGKWIDINQYSRWPRRSRKFAHSSTEEDDRQNIRQWQFAAYINPNEQFNVYRQTSQGWQLVAYVIGMNVKTPKQPTSTGDDDDKKNKDFSNALGLPLAADREFAISQYHCVLHREPAERETRAQQARLSSVSRADLIYGFFGSPEYAKRKTLPQQFVRDAYQSILGREPSPAESNKWVRYLTKSRGMRRGVLNSLLNSDEYTQLESKRTGRGEKGHRKDDRHDDRDKHKDNHRDKDLDKDKDYDKEDTDSKFNKPDAQKAYKEYIAAYNKLTSLMAAGKGDTPEAQKAYKEYKAAKDKYEAMTK